MKNFVFDPKRNLLIVKKGSLVQKHLKFPEKIIVGMYSNFWGNIEAKEIILGKDCYIGGAIVCEKVIVGAYTKFNKIHAKNVVLLSRCKGNFVEGIDVKVYQGSVINKVVAENVTFLGSSKVKKLVANKKTVLKL